MSVILLINNKIVNKKTICRLRLLSKFQIRRHFSSTVSFKWHISQTKFLIFDYLVASKAAFSTQNTFLGSVNPDLNHNLRVMSTPEWPVPYYQRVFRHPASLEKREGNLNHFLVPVHDFHAILAKELLKSMKLGYIVEAIENHYDLENYKT